MNLSTYLKEIQKELRLTTFPSQNVVINFTAFVVIFTGAMAMFLGALDLGFGETIIQGINNYKTPIEIATSTATSTIEVSTSTIINTATSVPANILVQ